MKKHSEIRGIAQAIEASLSRKYAMLRTGNGNNFTAFQLSGICILGAPDKLWLGSTDWFVIGYQMVVILLLASTAFWTVQLRFKLAEHVNSSDTTIAVRLWLAWALLCVTPMVLFFGSGVYNSNIAEPSRFVTRLNNSLARFHLAFSTESGRLLRIEPFSRGSLRMSSSSMDSGVRRR